MLYYIVLVPVETFIAGALVCVRRKKRRLALLDNIAYQTTIGSLEVKADRTIANVADTHKLPSPPMKHTAHNTTT